MNEVFTKSIYTSNGIVRDNIFKGRQVLDIGCGQQKLPGAIGMDIVKNSVADIIHDASVIPWPFKDNHFDVAFANHFVEHMDDLITFFNEVHRILKPGGRFIMQVPYFRWVDAYADPTHRHFFTASSLDYFIQDTKLAEYHYTDVRFKKVGFWYGWPAKARNPFIRLFKRYITQHPRLYDQYVSLLLPVPCLTWELEAIK